MPRGAAKLEDRIIRDFEHWVEIGAPDPRDRPPDPAEVAKDTAWPAVLERRKAAWSLQPVGNPRVPAARDDGWSRHPVDRFLLARMEAEGLKPSGDADPRALYRRLSCVLAGLPPKPEEVERFAAAAGRGMAAAIDDAVDRMLASPRFGERWARHWMDWLRYADTHGSEGDPPIPFAWRYRDYLIRALNADVPYPQLVREHIAGDLLEAPRVNRELGINESALGVAHYRMVLHGFAPTDPYDELLTFTDNQIDTISKAFLGLTVSCARCHDHKFDAISQTDFYSLFGIMASCRPATVDVNLPERQRLHIARLAALKQSIRASAAAVWLRSIDAAVGRLMAWQPDDKESPAPPLVPRARLARVPFEKWNDEWRRMQDEWRDYERRLALFRSLAV
jgi:hypothetical protein